jgi:lysozyme family protein
MAAPTYRQKWPTYAKQWDAMVMSPGRAGGLRNAGRKIVAAKARYKVIEKATGVPWYMIGALHIRESDQNWSRSLGQGDPWNRVSVRVPAGRGPFKSFEDAAIDALVTLKRLNRVKDWRLEKILYYSEQYNGWGYSWKGLASPYLWGGTNIQQAGKYVADGRFSSTAWDQQSGVAGMIKAVMDLDKTVKPVRET